MLNARQVFASYAQKYTAEGDERVGQQSTGRRTVKQNFVVDDEMLLDFRQQLMADGVTIDEDGFKQDLEFIKAMIRFEIDAALFGVVRCLAPHDRGRSAGTGRAWASSARPRGCWN